MSQALVSLIPQHPAQSLCVTALLDLIVKVGKTKSKSEIKVMLLLTDINTSWWLLAQGKTLDGMSSLFCSKWKRTKLEK